MESQGAATPGAQALTSYLSSPFRRLDKYPVLLKELERHIDVSNSYSNMSTCRYRDYD